MSDVVVLDGGFVLQAGLEVKLARLRVLESVADWSCPKDAGCTAWAKDVTIACWGADARLCCH